MTRIHLLAPTMIATIALLAVSCEPAPDATSVRAEVAATLASYRDAWLAGDAEAVMAHVSDSVVLYVPGRGRTPVRGKAAVRAHYFPPADTTYPITRYEIQGERIHVGGDLAVAEGRSVLGFNTVVAGAVVDSASAESEYLTVMVRQDGRWRIHRQMYVVR